MTVLSEIDFLNTENALKKLFFLWGGGGGGLGWSIDQFDFDFHSYNKAPVTKNAA